jgi:hypothetical protein
MENNNNNSANAVTEECLELKNIKYKSMLMGGVQLQETKSSGDFSNLDKFLETEKNNNKNEPWSKLDKTIKSQKLLDYAEKYKNEHEMNDGELELLVAFLKDCLNRKKLYRVKDVTYDKETGIIKEIPALTYLKASKHFTLKNLDKRVSTLKSLPPPKKGSVVKSSIKNKKPSVVDSDEELEA